VQAGAICDNIEKAVRKESNRSKLRPTMCMLGIISELTGHWQYRQCKVADQLKVLPPYTWSSMYVYYLWLSMAKIILKSRHSYTCWELPVFLACCIARSASLTRLYACFFIRAQESSLWKSKSEEARRNISIQQNVNDYALGVPGNPGCFKIPYDEKETTISDINMDGTFAPRLRAANDLNKFHSTLKFTITHIL
jgi:hypothetical protein